MTDEKLPPCKECHKPPTFAMYPYQAWITHEPYTDCVYGKKNVAMPSDLWKLIHTPDPRIAELTAQVHELEKLLDESHVVAAALDTELRALKSRQPIWDTITQAADAIPESALADVPTDGASNHDKYLYDLSWLTDASGPERRIIGEYERRRHPDRVADMPGPGQKIVFDHVAETKPKEAKP